MSYNLSDGGNGMVMPVSPMGYGNGGCCNDGFGFGGNGAWWLLVLFLFAANGNGFGWGNNGNGMMPYMMNNNTNNDVQRGFDQQAVMSGLGDISGAVTTGFSGVNQALCNGFAGVNATVNNGFNSAEVANNSRQMANMNQMYTLQTGISNQLNQLAANQAQCCCDNRLATANLNSTILSENCADRAALSDGIRDIIANQTANTQALINQTTSAVQGVYDKICQLELNAKNDRIAELQSQLAAANTAAMVGANTSRILSDNAAQTAALEQYLNPPAIPAYLVQNPRCCGNVNYGQCGCN